MSRHDFHRWCIPGASRKNTINPSHHPSIGAPQQQLVPDQIQAQTLVVAQKVRQLVSATRSIQRIEEPSQCFVDVPAPFNVDVRVPQV